MTCVVKTSQNDVKFVLTENCILVICHFVARAHNVTQYDQRKKEFDGSIKCFIACF